MKKTVNSCSSLILVRHGQSQWNLENRFTGWEDVPLSPHGEKEANIAGKKLKPYDFEIAFTSVLKRAVDTLDIILHITGQLDIPIAREKALNERFYGELQGLNKAETIKKYGEEQVKLWRRSYDVKPPGGESLKDTAARVIPFFECNILPHLLNKKQVLIVAHGNSLRALVMHIDKLKKEDVLELNIPTGIPIVYKVDSSGSVSSGIYL